MFTPPYSSNKLSSRKIRVLLFVLLLSAVIGGCRKEVEKERLTSYYGNSYTEIFEAFWNGMNTNYMFWNTETVNWDNMYKTYKPRFEYLDTQKNDPQAAEKAVQYLVDMTKDLQDSHLSLTFNGIANFLIAGYPVQSNMFSPANVRHQLRVDSDAISRKVFDQVIPKYYLTNA